jgi:hypothetical protein
LQQPFQEALGVPFGVTTLRAYQHKQAAGDAADCFTGDIYVCLTTALKQADY